jgi:hypothetical protein
MSVALSVAFTGLIALVSGGNGGPGQALLVDAKEVGRVGGIALPQHAPTLVVSMPELANAESSAPTRVIAAGSEGVEQVGLWDLTGSEVRVRAAVTVGTGLRLYQPADGESSWPNVPRDVNDPAAWRDPRFVPSMKAVLGDGRIHPSLLGSIDSVPTELPRSVAARIYLDAGILEGALPSHESFRSDLFEFRKNGSEPARQALTDTVRWTLNTGADAIVIDITPVAGGPAKRLVLAPSANPHRVFISNLPSVNPSHDHLTMTDDEIGTLHFAAYYKLLMNAPADEALPALRRVEHGRKGAGFISEMPCFSAWFSE